MITVEYLLPFNTKDGICKNIDSFKSLLSSNSNFKVKNNKIEYNGSSYDFKITLNVVRYKDCSVSIITKIGFDFCGTTVLLQNSKPLYPFGYPYAYKINHQHQNMITFRKPRVN